MSHVHISQLAANFVDDHDSALVAEWDGRSLVLSIYPHGSSDGPAVAFDPAMAARLRNMLSQILPGADI